MLLMASDKGTGKGTEWQTFVLPCVLRVCVGPVGGIRTVQIDIIAGNIPGGLFMILIAKR